MRDRDREPEQFLEAGEETLGLAQWHPEHRAKALRAQDRCIAVALALAAARPPAGQHRLVDPERGLPARHEGAVVVRPIRDPILRLWCSRFYAATPNDQAKTLISRC